MARPLALLAASLTSIALALGCGRQSDPASAPGDNADYDAVTLGQRMQSPAPPVIIDVREPSEFAEGHLHGARNIPIGQLEARAGEVPSDKPIVLVCQGGTRSARARDILVAKGRRNVHNFTDGMSGWNGALER